MRVSAEQVENQNADPERDHRHDRNDERTRDAGETVRDLIGSAAFHVGHPRTLPDVTFVRPVRDRGFLMLRG